jgi:hypothetical protein
VTRRYMSSAWACRRSLSSYLAILVCLCFEALRTRGARQVHVKSSACRPPAPPNVPTHREPGAVARRHRLGRDARRSLFDYLVAGLELGLTRFQVSFAARLTITIKFFTAMQGMFFDRVQAQGIPSTQPE